MRPRAPEPPGSFARAGLHLAALSAFALAQPLFDLLSRNAEFFAVRGSARWDIVLFALGVVVVPPLALLAVEALAGLAHARAAAATHLVFVAGLVGLVCLGAIDTWEAPDAGLLAAAAAAGTVAAALYLRARPARMLLSVLGAAPLLFVGLFLLASPVSRLVLRSAPEPRLAQVPAEAPVVVVVFDELSTVSLLNVRKQIDAVRYPSFARLAEDATWYRNATTVHEWTTDAVPAALTGRWPDEDELPLYLDHPDNLFTLLGGSYRLRAFESQTHLCPPRLCDQEREPLADRLGSLVSDLSVVYAHVVLPEDLGSRLPPISNAWRNFRGADEPSVRLQTGPVRPGARPAAYENRDAYAERFVDAIERGPRPPLFFLHILLPHHPWEYLPNGKRYASTLSNQPGMVHERWVGDPALAVQAQQRYLLQLGFADRVLGNVLDRLEGEGLYDDALVVVLADHGVSFRPHSERRRVHAGNLEEIAFVPLLVKAPAQRTGRIVDAHVRTIDVLPTMADILGVPIPWRTDGSSALDLRPGGHPEVVVFTSSGERVTGGADELVERRDRVLARQLRLFGEGDGPPGLFAVGPRPELHGRPVDRFPVAHGSGATVELDGDAFYDPDAPVVPTRASGRLEGVSTGRDVAVAVNGRIAATTRTFALAGDVLFSAVLPESAFRTGTNRVRIFLVDGPRLLEVAQAGT
ncbi:MAG: sulfatase-like hydrolase/transferase [Gaiellaceae bacterium]